jgi:protein TonB
MFEELPETIPHKNKKKPRAIALAAIVHVVLVSAIILVQMAMPEKLGEFQILTTLYMAPPPPPPPAPLSAPPEAHPRALARTAVAETPAVVEQPQPVETPQKPEMTAPVAIPKDIARITDAAPPASIPSGARGGIIGGTAGGVNGGLLGGVLGGAGTMQPPPPPKEPIRVGGNVKEPKIVHIEQPKYPPEAKRANVTGVVILEATVTEQGTVEKVKVISGPPMLVGPAVEAVSKWRYEPTYLNGQAVPVILTARISFSLGGNPQ